MTTRLKNALRLTESLADALTDADLTRRNGSAPSNPIAGQLWCLVGARESHAKAIAAARWSGFSCSLGGDDVKRVASIREALVASRTATLDTIAEHDMTDERLGIVFDLLEHEVQHHGQLIRYFYANGLAFPDEFAQRYSLQQRG
ncbi:MAG: hypothetical protein AAF533_14365 [Acidobacteriota bacterium]